MVGEIDVGPSAVDDRGPSLRSRDGATPSRLDRAMGDYAPRTHRQALWVETKAPAPAKANSDQRFMGMRKT
jgi:hypothetical protein